MLISWQQTIASMVKTDAGRRKLSLFAEALERRFAPLVEAAEAVQMLRDKEHSQQPASFSSGEPEQLTGAANRMMMPRSGTEALNTESISLASSLQQIRESFLNSGDREQADASPSAFSTVQARMQPAVDIQPLPSRLVALPPQPPVLQPFLGAFHGLYANQARLSTLMPNTRFTHIEGERENQHGDIAAAAVATVAAAAAAAAAAAGGASSFGAKGVRSAGAPSFGMLPTDFINPFDISRRPSFPK